MGERSAATTARDLLIARLSIAARKALLRGKESIELVEAGLVRWGLGETELGKLVRERMFDRGMKP